MFWSPRRLSFESADRRVLVISDVTVKKISALKISAGYSDYFELMFTKRSLTSRKRIFGKKTYF